MANTTQQTSTTANLTPSEKILAKEKNKKAKLHLTPSEKILARERLMRGEPAVLNQQDVKDGKAYRRIDVENGVLTQPEEIVLYKAMQKKDILFNGLLGVYDEEGNYTIPTEIRKELATLNKTSGESFEDTFYAIAKSEDDPFKTLKFAMQVQKNDDETKTATLKVLEEVEQKGGLYNNTISTFVAEYTDSDSEDFTQKAFDLFNIIRTTDNMTNFLIEDLAPRTMKRKQSLKELLAKYLKELGPEERALLESRTKLFDGGSKEMTEVLKKLDDATRQLEQYRPDRPRRFGRDFMQNSILENLVDNLTDLAVKSLFGNQVESLITKIDNKQLLTSHYLENLSPTKPREQEYNAQLVQEQVKVKQHSMQMYDQGKSL